MSWLQDLYAAYESSYGNEPDGSSRLMPVAHTTQQAHIEVVLDAQGRFLRASVVDKERNTTLIPCTEASGGRAGSKPASHPLCDKLQYLAADFTRYGGEVTSGFAKDPAEPNRTYLAMLAAWAGSVNGHPKLDAILRYVRQGSLVCDLIAAKVLPVNQQGRLATEWTGDKAGVPAIYKVLPAGQRPQDAFIRWSVDTGSVQKGTWEDDALISAWIRHYAESQTRWGFCMVQGKLTTLAEQHPAKLRNAADKAKLISANDDTGFTFRGRFLDAGQAVGVGYEVTQKAHNALRWLIERQGSRKADQVVVAWATHGISVPDPMADTLEIFDDGLLADPSAGQHFAVRLRQAIAGYRQRLDDDEHVIVLVLDSATPGRMSIVFYRKLRGSEFLDRLENWHLTFAWPQVYGKERQFVGAPAPRDIAQAAYGARVDEKLEKATRERLLPCIVDGTPLPRDLAVSAFHRALNRVGQEQREWEKCLGIACSLFKGTHRERNYQMALERDRDSRDYLYGRLLALAESIEQYALHLADEKRETNAARMMANFAIRPMDTWLSLESQKLLPYRSRLNGRAPDFLNSRLREIGEVCDLFKPDEFASNQPLTGEFLLGYHCQRSALLKKKAAPDNDGASAEQSE